MTTDETMPELPETPFDVLPEPDDTTDPETTAHEDPDPETIAHVADADDEALAGHLQEGRLDGHEDGRLLD